MSTTLTRDQLYALVWSEPIQKIVFRYGLSDRGFGKLCARYDIAVPPRGWWAKKAAGHRVRQTPLPPLALGRSATVIIEGRPRKTVQEPPTESQLVPPEIAFERDPANAIVVDENARVTHHLVRDAAAELRSRSKSPTLRAFGGRWGSGISARAGGMCRLLATRRTRAAITCRLSKVSRDSLVGAAG